MSGNKYSIMNCAKTYSDKDFLKQVRRNGMHGKLAFDVFIMSDSKNDCFAKDNSICDINESNILDILGVTYVLLFYQLYMYARLKGIIISENELRGILRRLKAKQYVYEASACFFTKDETGNTYAEETGQSIYVLSPKGFAYCRSTGIHITFLGAEGNTLQYYKRIIEMNAIILNQLVYNNTKIKNFCVNYVIGSKNCNRMIVPLIINAYSESYFFFRLSGYVSLYNVISMIVSVSNYCTDKSKKASIVFVCDESDLSYVLNACNSLKDSICQTIGISLPDDWYKAESGLISKLSLRTID